MENKKGSRILKMRTKKQASSVRKAVLLKRKQQKGKQRPAKADQSKRRIPKELPEGGVVYLSHLPHGFYEEQITDYFKQFGKVRDVKLARSKKTGRCQGYGYVRFRDREVAAIAAQTMNNYLMTNRLVKAVLLDTDQAKKIRFFHKGQAIITPETCPKAISRNAYLARRNAIQTLDEQHRYIYQAKAKLDGIKNKLHALGIPGITIELPPK